MALFSSTQKTAVWGRLQVETDDSGRLLLELRVIADHVVARLPRAIERFID
jgi:hypothetical protein